MMKTLFDDIVKNNPLYEFFSTNQDFWKNCPVDLIKTPCKYKGEVRESENSLTFKVGKNENQLDVLKRIFGIENESFEEKYSKAISGDGHESRRILTLHSSSLLSLLCFYKVSTQPLELEFCTADKVNHTCKFTDVSFESKNCLSNAYMQGKAYKAMDSKSNMDVVLFEGDSKDPNTVLFLESKFTEYLHNGAVSNISQDAYEDIYKELGLVAGNNGLDVIVEPYKNKDDRSCYKMKACGGKRTGSYLEGVKQMISHFMGACTYAADHPKIQVYLGSIVYRFEDQIYNGKFENYNAKFHVIMQALQGLLKKHQTCSNLHLIDNLLTYNELFSKNNLHILDDKVARFYRL